MRFQCPYCKTILDIDNCLPGELVACGKCGNAVNVPLSKTAPGAIIGDFVVLREIGTGGMGTVFLAHQISLDRDVALKILLPAFESDKHFLQDFINEARMAAQIRHPNVVEAYAVGKDDASKTYYFAMEYVDGPTLKQQVEMTGPLAESRVLEIASEMIDALSYAWNEKKLIHRDIKPDNILLNSLNQTKLADLGLAKKVTEINEDGSSELFGTPQCIAPELVFGNPATPSSDIYALGATFYFLLTGQFPYASQNVEDIVTMHLETPLPPIGEPDAPTPLATLIRIMMAKRPCHRYQDYDELKNDLELVKAGQMPNHEDIPEAQIPIDSNAADPMLPLGNDDNTTEPAFGSAKKLSIKGGKGKLTLDKSKPTSAIGDAQSSNASPIAGGAQPQKSAGKGKLIAIIAIIVILLGAGGAFFAFGGKKTGDSNTSKTLSGGKKVDTNQLDTLLADGSDAQAIISEVTRLLPDFPPDQPASAEFNTKVAPFVEKALAEARKAKYDELKATWDAGVAAMKAKAEMEAREAERKAAEEKAEAEAKAAKAAEEKAKKDEEAAFAQKQTDFREKLLEYANKHDFSHPVVMLSEMEASDNEQISNWAKSWHDRIDKAEKFYKLFKDSQKKYAGTFIPVLGDKQEWEIDNITFTSISIYLTRTNYDSKKKKDITSTTRGKLNLDTLLPPQLLKLAYAAADKEECSKDEAQEMLATYLLIRGANLKYVKDQLEKLGDTFGAEEADALNGAEYLKSMIQLIPQLSSTQVKPLLYVLKNYDANAFENAQEEIEELKKNAKQ
ncbi:MAG: protein kinase [Victivallales bacterium]|nr:protein kinase [Victivallales bacterium]